MRIFQFPILSLLLLAGTQTAPATDASPTAAAATPEALPLSTLADAIAANNPELQFYEAQIAAAKAGRRAATRLADPELSLELGRKRVRESSGGLEAEGTAWSVSVRQTFEWPGRMGLRKAIANHDVALAELGLARFRQALRARANLLGHSLHSAQAKATALQEVAGRFDALRAVFLAREPAGITPLLEGRVIEATALSLRRRATEAELQLQAALIELNLLRGAPAATPLRVAAPPLAFGAPPNAEALIAAARENNFDYRARRIELEQQGAEVRLTRHERLPSVSLSPYVSQEKAGDRETVAGIGFAVPIPLKSRARDHVEAAEARRQQAETVLLLSERELERDVLTTAQTYTARQAEIQGNSREALNAFREAAELADRHYRLGAVPIATYVELQNSYLDAVEALLDSERDALEAALKLQQLSGLDLNLVQTLP